MHVSFRFCLLASIRGDITALFIYHKRERHLLRQQRHVWLISPDASRLPDQLQLQPD